MEMKYKFTDEVVDYCGYKLHRIEALRDFGNVKKGDKGGLIESEDNLSQEGECWVYPNAKVYGKAKVFDNAWVFDNAVVSYNAVICGKGMVGGNAIVIDNGKVCDAAGVFDSVVVRDNAVVCGLVDVNGDADLGGDAVVECAEDYMTFDACWCTAKKITYTNSNKKYHIDWRYLSGEELISLGYEESRERGECYKAMVEYVEKVYDVLEKSVDEC